MTQTAANQRGSGDRDGALGKEYADYVVLDPAGRKIGHVKEFFTNARGEPEYIMVRVGFFRMRSVLLPVRFVTLDEERRTLTLQ